MHKHTHKQRYTHLSHASTATPIFTICNCRRVHTSATLTLPPHTNTHNCPPPPSLSRIPSLDTYIIHCNSQPSRHFLPFSCYTLSLSFCRSDPIHEQPRQTIPYPRNASSTQTQLLLSMNDGKEKQWEEDNGDKEEITERGRWRMRIGRGSRAWVGGGWEQEED